MLLVVCVCVCVCGKDLQPRSQRAKYNRIGDSSCLVERHRKLPLRHCQRGVESVFVFVFEVHCQGTVAL